MTSVGAYDPPYVVTRLCRVVHMSTYAPQSRGHMPPHMSCAMGGHMSTYARGFCRGFSSRLGGGICRVVQGLPIRCSVLQCVAVCCSVLQCVAVCCSVLQCVAVCCSVLQCVTVRLNLLQCVTVRSALQCTVKNHACNHTLSHFK